MIVTSIKTHKITKKEIDIFKILDRYISTFKNKSVLAVTSKIVSICEGSLVKAKNYDKDILIRKHADLYLERTTSRYNVVLTVKNNTLAAGSGIDESNAFGHYILWPKDAQKTADAIRKYLLKRFKLRHVGVIVTDSKTTPLKWGTTGTAIAHSGFQALEDYIGKKDIFGRAFQYVKLNIADGLAGAAVVVMGEGKEQTPLAVIEDVPFVKFQDRNPSKKELDDLKIEIEDDLYAPILTKAEWKNGRK